MGLSEQFIQFNSEMGTVGTGQALSDIRLLGLSAVGQMREVLIPIHDSTWPVLKAVFPLSEEAWVQMIVVLNAMKPGLVAGAQVCDG